MRSSAARAAAALTVVTALMAVGLVEREARADDEEEAFLRGLTEQVAAVKAAAAGVATRAKALEQRADGLEAQVSALAARLARAEARVGLGPVETTSLKRMPGDRRLTLADAALVDRRGAKPKRGKLSRHLARFEGYVVAYWATWCKPCTSPEELVHLEQLRADLHRWDMELVSVAVDGIDAVQGDARAGTWLYPLWQGDGIHLQMLPRTFIEEVGVGLPLFLVVSKSGHVHWYRNLPLDDGAVQDIVSAAASLRGL